MAVCRRHAGSPRGGGAGSRPAQCTASEPPSSPSPEASAQALTAVISQAATRAGHRQRSHAPGTAARKVASAPRPGRAGSSPSVSPITMPMVSANTIASAASCPRSMASSIELQLDALESRRAQERPRTGFLDRPGRTASAPPVAASAVPAQGAAPRASAISHSLSWSDRQASSAERLPPRRRPPPMFVKAGDGIVEEHAARSCSSPRRGTPVATGMTCASARHEPHVVEAFGRRFAGGRARASASSRSSPVTSPSEARTRAAARVEPPVPHPTSTTRSEPPMSCASWKRCRVRRDARS